MKFKSHIYTLFMVYKWEGLEAGLGARKQNWTETGSSCKLTLWMTPREAPTETLIVLWQAATSCFLQSLGAAPLGKCFFWMDADCTTKDACSVWMIRRLLLVVCLLPSVLLSETESRKRLELPSIYPLYRFLCFCSFAAASLISSAFRRCIFIPPLNMFTRVCPLFPPRLPLWARSSFIPLSRSLHLGYRCRRITKTHDDLMLLSS